MICTNFKLTAIHFIRKGRRDSFVDGCEGEEEAHCEITAGKRSEERGQGRSGKVIKAQAEL